MNRKSETGWSLVRRTLLCSAVGILAAGCATERASMRMEMEPHDPTTGVMLSGSAEIGDLRLWVPEAIMSNTGGCAIYPTGEPWRREGPDLVQEVAGDGIYGGGNCPRIDERTFECVGIRFPVDSPVRWTTRLSSDKHGVTFTIRLTNAGGRTIQRCGAAICLKFAEGSWWSDAVVYVRSGGRVRTLAELGRDAGATETFQAYLLEGESFEHEFYRRFWGISRHRLDAPMMVSEHRAAGLCVGIESDRAYFLHSNRGNPCTDIMLAFGDVAPGATTEATGRVWIRRGRARDFLGGSTLP